MTNSFTFFNKKIIPCLVLIIQERAKLKQDEWERAVEIFFFALIKLKKTSINISKELSLCSDLNKIH